MMKPISPQEITTRSRRSWHTSVTVKARCSKEDGSDGRKSTTNGLESMNLRGHKKYCSNTKTSTPVGMLKHLNRKRKAREKHQLRGKSALSGDVRIEKWLDDKLQVRSFTQKHSIHIQIYLAVEQL